LPTEKAETGWETRREKGIARTVLVMMMEMKGEGTRIYVSPAVLVSWSVFYSP